MKYPDLPSKNISSILIWEVSMEGLDNLKSGILFKMYSIVTISNHLFTSRFSFNCLGLVKNFTSCSDYTQSHQCKPSNMEGMDGWGQMDITLLGPWEKLGRNSEGTHGSGAGGRGKGREPAFPPHSIVSHCNHSSFFFKVKNKTSVEN